MLCVVKALDIVSWWCVVCTPGHANSYWVWFRKGPVHMVHHVQCSRNILVEIRLRQIVCHVVEEVDVLERPVCVIHGVWTRLKILKIRILLKDKWE